MFPKLEVLDHKNKEGQEVFSDGDDDDYDEEDFDQGEGFIMDNYGDEGFEGGEDELDDLDEESEQEQQDGGANKRQKN